MSGFDGAGKNDVVAAAWRGTVAAMAMSGMREFTISLRLVGRPPPDEIAAEGVPGLFGPIPPPYRDAAVEVAHWTYGAAMGFSYALMPRPLRRRGWFGPAYGIAIWALFERIVAPLLGLRTAGERPLRERAAIASDHVLYGIVVAHRPLDPDP